mmetsp:Transcript_14440/g.25398  ORF Transcript_14440/g.25398 Transcript_14440/m.25398 type:complete len:231 (-) Transcript_14440:167-859(-)
MVFLQSGWSIRSGYLPVPQEVEEKSKRCKQKKASRVREIAKQDRRESRAKQYLQGYRLVSLSDELDEELTLHGQWSDRACQVSEYEASAGAVEGPRQTQILWARWTHPQELTFEAPAGVAPGVPICIAGPLGPMFVPMPEGLQPGDTCVVRLGPPEGDRPDVASPGLVVMVEVPCGAIPGDQVLFHSPEGCVMCVPVPPGVRPGNFFAANVDLGGKHTVSDLAQPEESLL